MEACLVIIGLDSRTAPLAVRQRFRMKESLLQYALLQLSGMEGITESAVLATADRTDFVLWASDFSAAANSVLTFLTREYGLRLCEWQHFHRLLGEEALRYLFRMATGLTTIVLGDPQSARDVEAAWTAARQAGTSGPLLDQVLDKALKIAALVQQQTALPEAAHDGGSARAIAAAEALVTSELRDFCKHLPSERAAALR